LVLYHDAHDHVLVFEDLGPLVSLHNYLAAYQCEEPAYSVREQDVCYRLGSRIGEFFAELHNPQSLKEIRSGGFVDSSYITRDMVLQHAVLPVKKYLLEHKIPDAQMLYSRVLDDFSRADLPDELSFVLGDFTPSAVLLEAHGTGNQRVAVIDWEFAGQGRGPHGDMAQCLATLHILLSSAPANSASFNAIEACMRGICSAYCQKTSTWLGQTTSNAGTVSKNLRLRLLRSAFIMHGREIINNAVEREWPRSLSVESMVRMGAWYLERAGGDVEAMVSHANWNELLKEDHRIITSLFGVDVQDQNFAR
jgi:hypothetical protein